MNKVVLIGNLTKDPEFMVTSNDISNCKFSIAVTRNYNKRETDFFSIVCWRGLAENCNKYLRKGSKVGISGNIQNKNYEGKDGIKRYSTEIVAEEVQFLTTKDESEALDSQEEKNVSDSETKTIAPKKNITKLTPVADDDDLPF
ncbi:MAG: single-stranded DNA-binding protein [Clostridia bacterium]